MLPAAPLCGVPIMQKNYVGHRTGMEHHKAEIFSNAVVFLLLSILFVSQAGSGEIPPEISHPGIRTLLDGTHAKITKTMEDISYRIDTFFVDERVDEEMKNSRLRIRVGATLAEAGRSELYQRTSLHLQLPRTERRLQFVLDSFTRDEYPDEEAVPRIRENDENRVEAALRYVFGDTDIGHMQFHTGLSFKPDPEFYMKTRWRKIFPITEKWRFYPTQFFFWKSRDGFGETTRADIERPLSDDSLFRIRAEATWSEISSGLEFIALMSYSQTLSNLRGWGIALSAEGDTRPSAVTENYRMAFKYRRAIHRDWLFLEVEPAIDFFREDNYRASPGITFQIEAIFKKKKKLR